MIGRNGRGGGRGLTTRAAVVCHLHGSPCSWQHFWGEPMDQRCVPGKAPVCLSPPSGPRRGLSTAGGTSRGARGCLRRGACAVVLVGLLSLSGLAGAQDLRWQDAVATLAA